MRLSLMRILVLRPLMLLVPMVPMFKEPPSQPHDSMGITEMEEMKEDTDQEVDEEDSQDHEVEVSAEDPEINNNHLLLL